MSESFSACRRLYPGGTDGSLSLASISPALRSVGGGLPHYVAIFGFRIYCFGASMAFHLCSGLQTRGAAKQPFPSGASAGWLSAAVPIATGCNDYFPGGTFTRWTPSPFARRTTQLVDSVFDTLFLLLPLRPAFPADRVFQVQAADHLLRPRFVAAGLAPVHAILKPCQFLFLDRLVYPPGPIGRSSHWPGQKNFLERLGPLFPCP